MSEQVTIMGDVPHGDAPDPNPMVRVYGPDPLGRTCRECRFLFAFETDRRYFKCEKRRVSHSVATDHRARWRACALIEEGRS